MEERIEPTGNEKDLRMENDFLKMKMMLEHGAAFGSSKDLPPAIENEFLKHVMEYEKQFELGKRIKVYDKLGRPDQFKPMKEIPDHEMQKEWESLYEFMSSRGIELSVCSPKIKARELYRFTMEELFEMETDSIDMPGMMTCFIYDEFHPDVEYDNSRMAIEYCMNYLFDKTAFFDYHFAEKVRLNQHGNLSRSELKFVIQNFKHEYDQIVPLDIRVNSCSLKAKCCVVKGSYEVAFMIKGKSEVKRGEWMVAFKLHKESGYWHIADIQVKGIKIP